MKIALVTTTYTYTGVSLAQVRLAKALARVGHQVEFLLGNVGEGCAEPNLPGITVSVFEKPRARALLFPLIRYLKAHNPEIVFTAEDHLNGVVLLAAILSGTRVKISGSSRVPPSASYSNVLLTRGWINKLLFKLVMWRADALTCVSEDMVSLYREYFRHGPHVCAHNIVGDSESLILANEPVAHSWLANKETPIIIAAGTLTVRKGFCDLIQAMHLVRQRCQARLIILGEGDQREKLEAQVRELNLQSVVSLPGFEPNPYRYYANSDVFVLSSYAEGMPNVLIEAMACGCTPVATDCPTGPREIIQDGKYGYLVPMRNPGEMANAIIRALDNPTPAYSLKEIVSQFSEDTVLRQHFRLLGIPGTT